VFFPYLGHAKPLNVFDFRAADKGADRAARIDEHVSANAARRRKPSPVKVIDFLLIGHLQPTVPLGDLLAQGVFNNRPPQSVAELGETRYKILKPSLHIGFDL
jgi:hypothetical protein